MEMFLLLMLNTVLEGLVLISRIPLQMKLMANAKIFGLENVHNLRNQVTLVINMGRIAQ